MNYVGFPGLGLSFNINPVAFTLFGKDIYWYGIIIGCGLLIAAAFCSYLASKDGLPNDTVTDIVLIGTPVGIICARLYFVIFDFASYKDNLLSVFAIWEGGLAIYGGIIGAVLSAYLYCRHKKLNVLKVFDICVLGLLIGQLIGRWGNFVNAEAYGCETTLPWRMQLMSDEAGKMVCVHPTFLYESLWNLAGLIMLMIYRKHKKFDGELFLMYIMWYGLGRSWIEWLRVDSLPYSGGFKISQIVAVVSAAAAFVLIVINRKRRKQA